MMTGAPVPYVQNAELPDLGITWQDSTGALIDFSTGWSFTVTVGPLDGEAALLTKTSGIAGANTDPNVTVSWVTGEFSTLAPGVYRGQVTARRTADGRDRAMQFLIEIRAAV